MGERYLVSCSAKTWATKALNNMAEIAEMLGTKARQVVFFDHLHRICMDETMGEHDMTDVIPDRWMVVDDMPLPPWLYMVWAQWGRAEEQWKVGIQVAISVS